MINNFRKLKRIVVIFAKQHQRSKEKLTVGYNQNPPQLISVATLPCKMKRSHSRYTTTPKGDKIPQKKTEVCYCIYCWVVYSSSKG